MKDWVASLPNKGKKVYSQQKQDGYLEAIFANIGTKSKRPFCVEFGFNCATLEGGTGSNVANLVLNKGWECLLLDGGFENPQINLHKHFITTDNICGLFRRYKVPQEPDYVSIDVDSTDLWLLRAILKEYIPRVVSIEYNSNFPLDSAITFPNDCQEVWEHDKGYGASLKALKLVADEFGYSLVVVQHGLDAFFVRNDLLDDGTSELVPPFATWAKHTYPNTSVHTPLKHPERVKIFIDYEEYLRTNGDLEKSRAKATPVCETCLL